VLELQAGTSRNIYQIALNTLNTTFAVCFPGNLRGLLAYWNIFIMLGCVFWLVEFTILARLIAWL
jgi:hypothetical protein